MNMKRFEDAPCYICGYNGPDYYQPSVHGCAKEYQMLTDGAEITRLRSFLERIRDGRICRRCLKFPLEWRIYDEDGRKHSCERENAREALEDGMP